MTAIYRVLIEPVQAGRPQPYLTGETFEGSESLNDLLVTLGVLEFVKSLGTTTKNPALDLAPFTPVSESEVQDILTQAKIDLGTVMGQTDESLDALELNLNKIVDAKNPVVSTDLNPIASSNPEQINPEQTDSEQTNPEQTNPEQTRTSRRSREVQP